MFQATNVGGEGYTVFPGTVEKITYEELPKTFYRCLTRRKIFSKMQQVLTKTTRAFLAIRWILITDFFR